jgi:glycosyltransferase involved in cell wall biosynthesis
VSEKPVILCFAGDVWDGNPHSRHYLMRRFAGDYEVIFIEGAFVRRVSQLGGSDWMRLLRKFRPTFSLRTVEPHLHVLRPLPIPPAGRLLNRVRLELLRLVIQLALQRLGLRGKRISWFSLPNVADLAGRLGEAGSIFYYQDRYAEFTNADSEAIRAHMRTLVRGCDVCVASSAALAEDLRELEAEPVVVPHGVDVERFAGEHAPPADVASLERPLVGFVGLLDDYLSFESLIAVADRLDRGTVVLVGGSNADTAALEHPRITMLGQRPFSTMPAYLAAFDCCLIPFEVSELTEAVNPIKLREYLAAGRPVVTTPLPEVLAYGDVASIAATPDEFADAVLAILVDPEADGDGARARRRARVAADSWDAAAERVREVMDPLVTPSHQSGAPSPSRSQSASS